MLIKLSFESSPVPLPEFITNSANCKITSLDMLINLPNYCKNQSHNFDIDPVKEILNLCNYSPKACTYSSHVLRFALQLRYISHAAYIILHRHMSLPSVRLLSKLKSNSIDSVKALCKLRYEGCIGNDVALLLDEMHLQQHVQFDALQFIPSSENYKLPSLNFVISVSCQSVY